MCEKLPGIIMHEWMEDRITCRNGYSLESGKENGYERKKNNQRADR